MVSTRLLHPPPANLEPRNSELQTPKGKFTAEAQRTQRKKGAEKN